MVEQFYRSKAAPYMLNGRPSMANAVSSSDFGLGLAPLQGSIHQAVAFTSRLHTFPKSNTVVNQSLDPRLQSRSAVSKGSLTISLSAPSEANATPDYHAQINVVAGRISAFAYQSKDRLQELEGMIVRLTAENFEKDREIRRLNMENEQLRGGKYTRGNKRPRRK